MWLYRNVAAIESNWPKAAYALAGASPMLRMEQDVPTPEQVARWVDEGR
jgi:hypothetical protein